MSTITPENAIEAAIALLPLLDRSFWRLRYSQTAKGLSPLEYRILDYVCYHQPAKIGDISRMVGLSFSNTSRYVKDLIKKELLSRERSLDDQRVQFLHLSEAGKALLLAIEQQIRAEAGLFLGKLSTQEAAHLGSACQELATALTPLLHVLEDLPI